VRSIIAHPKDNAVGAFYRKYGFVPSPTNPRTLILPMETAQAALL
jgi:hypothetical protein